MKLSNEVVATLEALRAAHEKTTVWQGRAEVYLDNARPAEQSVTVFRSHLSTLSKAGLYKVLDGYAWGEVKLGEG